MHRFSFSRRGFLGGLSAVALVTAARQSEAQLAVVCGNCSDIFNQLLQYAKQIAAYGTQLQQYHTQLAQYANMITNTISLPTQIWGTVQSDIMRVQSISNAASVLTGNAGSMLTRLQSASGYVDQVGSIANIPGQVVMWQQTIGNNLNTMGRTLGLQQSQQQDDAALLAALQVHSETAEGQKQAIQAGNELAAANGAQLQHIQQTLIAEAQMQANQYAVAADRRASQDADMLHFSQPTDIPIAGQVW